MDTTKLYDIVRQLTLPPAPKPPVPASAPEKSFYLFKHSEWGDNWNKDRVGISLDEYVAKKRHTVVSSMHDAATWVAYNLPVGTVVTLMEHITPLAEGANPADLAGCGVCLDLVGTGRTEAVDLKQVGLNDKVSAFFWRQVDLTRGGIELFEHDTFRGARTTLFLSEWQPAKVHSLKGWWLNDQISSVRWKSLRDRQTASLFNNPDGTGTSFDNIKGWARTKEVANLKDIRIGDAVSGFRWDPILPLKEMIEPFTIVAQTESIDTGLQHHSTGRNEMPEKVPSNIDYKVATVRQCSVETSEEHVAGIEVNITREAEVGIPDTFSAKASWSVALRYSYSHTDTTTTVDTKSTELTFTQNFVAPAKSGYSWDVVVYVGRIPSAKYVTKATRWYDVEVTGSTKDPENHGWWKRVEDIEVMVSGVLATRFDATFKSWDL